MRRVAGKAVNPHLVRDMVVTHVRSQDVSYKQLERTLSLVHGAQRETAAIHLRQAVQGTEGVASCQFVEHNRFQCVQRFQRAYVKGNV